MIFKRAVRESLVSRHGQEAISKDEVEFLGSALPRDLLQIRKNAAGSISSLAVPTKALRKSILNDKGLRDFLRGADLEIQDLEVKRGRTHMGQLMMGRVYVKDTKAVGLRGGISGGNPLADSLESLKAHLEDGAEVKTPAAVILLIAGGTIYGAFRLGNVVVRMGTDYAETLEAASTDQEGLDQAVNSRSGFSRGSDPSPGTIKPDEHVPEDRQIADEAP